MISARARRAREGTLLRRERLRAWRQALATRTLGLCTQHELRRDRAHAVQAARYASLEATVEARADRARRVSFHGPIPDAAAVRELRLLLLQRLALLRDRGFARRGSSVTFELSVELRPALRAMDWHHLLARFVGVARPEEESHGHWILEGVEGRVLVVPESAALGHWRARERVEPGDLVSLRGGHRPAAEAGGQTLTQAIHHGRLEEIEAAPVGVTVLDLEAVRTVHAGELFRPSPDASVRGFAVRGRAALERRRAMLERAGLLGAGALRGSPDLGEARSQAISSGTSRRG